MRTTLSTTLLLADPLRSASHARYILPGTMPTEGPEALDEDPLLVAHRQKAASILRRTELISLAATAVVPIAGAYLLFYVRNLLSDVRPSSSASRRSRS